MRFCLFLVATVLAAQPLVIAHRAFEGTSPIGSDILELDLSVTKDRQIVVHHDAVAHLNRTEIPQVRGAADVFAAARKSKARLMVETKMDPATDPVWFATQVAQLFEQHHMQDQVILQSFDHRTLQTMRKLIPSIPLVLLNPRTELPDYVTPARALGPHAIQFINFRVLTPAIVKTLKDAKIPIYSGTTSDPAEWKRLIALGVDAILTDDPAGLRALLPR
jgi:glycerophosphoryl diester phosphodiesterase